MANIYIYSTMSSDNDYIIYKDGLAQSKVTISGKANVTDKITLIVKEGAVTVLTQEQYDMIKENSHFKKHLDGGFLSVEQKQVETTKVSKNMTKKDKSAQKKKEDFKDLNADIVVE